MTTNPPVVMKVSGTGYLCVRNVNSDEWVVACELNNEQIRGVNETIEMINRRVAALPIPRL